MIEKEPVGEHDQAFDAAVEQHLKIAFKAAALIVYIGENRQIRSLVERVLDAAQHQRAIGIGHVEHHDAHGVAALAAQRTGKFIRPIAQLFRRALDALLGHRRDIARQRRVVENDRHRGGGEPTLLRYIANRNHRSVAPCLLELVCGT